MSYQIEVSAKHYQVEVKNGNDNQRFIAAYIVKSDLDGKFNYFITVDMTDAEILAKSDAMRFDSKGIFDTYNEAMQYALNFVSYMLSELSVLEVWANAANQVLNTSAVPADKISKSINTAKNYNYSKNNLACLAIKAFADAANQVLHIMIAEQADLANDSPKVGQIRLSYDYSNMYKKSVYTKITRLTAKTVWYRECNEAGEVFSFLEEQRVAIGKVDLYLGEPIELLAQVAEIEYQDELQTAIIENSDFATYTKVGKCFADNARTIVYLFKPENANTELEYEALQAGAAFDNSAPLPSFNKQYDLSGSIDEINEVIDTIATEQADDLTAIDDEITRLKARLLSLGSTRQDIVEEYTHWHCKAQERLNELEYNEAYDGNEAYDDLRQSIWFSTGQDIM
jgi:hypothetical protein